MVYTPDTNFNGTDSFSYTVTDGNGGSANATVSIIVTSVNDAPVASDDTLTLEQNTAAQVQVVANDTDIDGDTLTVISVGAATNGTTSVSNNQILYTPNADFVGTDSFTYEIDDNNGGTDTATVNVTIINGNLPVATNDTATVAEDTPIILDVLANDTDADSDTLSLKSVLLRSCSFLNRSHAATGTRAILTEIPNLAKIG